MPKKNIKKEAKKVTSKEEVKNEVVEEKVKTTKVEEKKVENKKASKNSKKAKVKSNNKVAKSDKKKNSNKWFKEFRAELKKVVWPSKGQLLENTTVVVSMVLIVAAIIFLLDLGFKELNSLEVKGAKAIKSSVSTNVVEENTTSENSVENAENVQVETSETENK